MFVTKGCCFFIVECGTSELKITVEEGSILECSNEVEYFNVTTMTWLTVTEYHK